jgi:diguanylate cyclase (GGDEF)-like protein
LDDWTEVIFLNWSAIPDATVMALLICAFASVAWNYRAPVSKLWLAGWLMILLHFGAALFSLAPGIWGILASIVLSAALPWAGVLFMHASIPYRKAASRRWMLFSLLGVNTLYLAILCSGSGGQWALNLAAIVLGLGPLAVTIASIREINHPLRWFIALLYGTLSIFLLIFQNRPGNGSDLAWNAVMFTVYLGCCVFVSYAYHRATAGAFVIITGFILWASVFVVSPMMYAFFPHMQIQSEVWNLPKYVVALGMMLLLLEDQIEHNKNLALHDMLTGLPNRRLFEDRMTSTLERSRRTGARMALLVIDLDGFKKVNDTLGHHVGDLVLQRVAAAFAERVRRSDTVARTGGDEFSVILEGPTNREDAEKVGNSLRQLLSDPLDVEGRDVRIAASIGTALFPEDASDSESLCIAADRRMYDTKRHTRKSSQHAAAAKQRSLPTHESNVKEELPLEQKTIPSTSES